MKRHDPPTAGPTDANGQPVTNTALVEAMRNVSVHDDSETRALLFTLLLETQLLAATPKEPKRAGKRTAGADESLSLVTLADGDGAVLPLFTSVDAWQKWRPKGSGYVALPSRTMFEMAAQNGTNKIALDPSSATSGILTRYEIEQLAGGRLPLGQAGDVVPASTEMRIGPPTVPPSTDVIDALRGALQAQPAADVAWYFLMQQGDQPPQMSVAIGFAPGLDSDKVPQTMRGIIDSAAERSDGVGALSFVVADEGWRSSLSGGAGDEFFSRQ